MFLVTVAAVAAAVSVVASTAPAGATGTARTAQAPRAVRAAQAPQAAGTAHAAQAAGAARSAPQAPSDRARAALRGIIENVTRADARKYGSTDDTGRSMDTAKVVQDSAGHYLAVYHTMLDDGRFHAALAASTDLAHWRFVHDFGAGSSQPTIVKAGDGGRRGGYVMAWEQDPDNHIAVRYYPSRAALFAGRAARRVDTPQTLSTCAEGTPNIYAVHLHPDIDHSTIDIGGHFYDGCKADRQMRGTLTDFTSWSATPQPRIDHALLHYGVQGNIGDRDAVTFRGFPFAVVEGQYVNGDFGSWRTFLYDYRTGRADATAIHTDGGSTAFANPSITVLRAPNGHRAVFVSLFLPSEGAAPGESGQLMYYRTY